MEHRIGSVVKGPASRTHTPHSFVCEPDTTYPLLAEVHIAGYTADHLLRANSMSLSAVGNFLEVLHDISLS
jgi:hypothetical protein